MTETIEQRMLEYLRSIDTQLAQINDKLKQIIDAKPEEKP